MIERSMHTSRTRALWYDDTNEEKLIPFWPPKWKRYLKARNTWSRWMPQPKFRSARIRSCWHEDRWTSQGQHRLVLHTDQKEGAWPYCKNQWRKIGRVQNSKWSLPLEVSWVGDFPYTLEGSRASWRTRLCKSKERCSCRSSKHTKNRHRKFLLVLQHKSFPKNVWRFLQDWFPQKSSLKWTDIAHLQVRVRLG